MAERGGATAPDVLHCERHGAGTRLTCSECGTPICPRCMVRTDVGLRCEPCAAPSGSPSGRSVSRSRLAIGLGAVAAGIVVLVAALAITRLSSGLPQAPEGKPGPVVGEWSQVPALQEIRGATAAFRLPDDRVAAVGGGVGSVPLAATEIFDSAAEVWTSAGVLQEARRGHTGVLFPDGRILIAGGISQGQLLASAELSEPGATTWEPTGEMNEPRLGHTMTLLGDGTVLVTGGTGGAGAASQGSQTVRPTATAEVFDPATGTWTMVGDMFIPRFEHAATPLPDGRVLITGGIGIVGESDEIEPVASAEVYDPASRTFSRTSEMKIARTNHATVGLGDGRVLVVGGDTGQAAVAGAEIFDLSRSAWTSVASLRRARRGHTATLLDDGTVLVAGGEFFSQGRRQSLSSAERYDPEADTWANAGEMNCPRSEHAAALLADGSVLVVAGDGAFPGEAPVAQSCVDRYVPTPSDS